MIIRNLEEMLGTARDVPWGNGQSRRFLVASDGMGVGLTDTTIQAGTSSTMQYRNHLMSGYVISGEGSLQDHGGSTHSLRPGTMYALDKHDLYTLHAATDMRILCVFNPPLQGHERHDLSRKDGSAY